MDLPCLRNVTRLLPVASLAVWAAAAPTVSHPEGTVWGTLGAPALIAYSVSWPDDEAPGVVLPPELPEVSWGRAWVAESRATSPRQVVVTVAVEADAPGRHEFPAPRIRVAAADAEVSGMLDTARSTTLAAAAVPVAFSAPWAVARWQMGAGLLGLIAALAAALWWRQRRQVASGHEALGAAEAARALLHDARRQRLDGDFYAYYKALARAAALAGASRLGAQLDEKTQSVGYRGVRPADEDMDGDLRAVERALAGQPGERHA